MTFIPEGSAYPEDRPAPAEADTPHTKPLDGRGTRVRHLYDDERLGTVVEVTVEGIRVDWDMVYGETIERREDLVLDAPMPDPAFALAKALRYRRQRDRALEDIARLVGLEAAFAAERARLHAVIEDARAEATMGVLGEAKARARAEELVAALRTKATEREKVVTGLRALVDRVVSIAGAAGTYDEEGTYYSGEDALTAIAELTFPEVVDKPTDEPVQ